MQSIPPAQHRKRTRLGYHGIVRGPHQPSFFPSLYHLLSFPHTRRRESVWSLGSTWEIKSLHVTNSSLRSIPTRGTRLGTLSILYLETYMHITPLTPPAPPSFARGWPLGAAARWSWRAFSWSESENQIFSHEVTHRVPHVQIP